MAPASAAGLGALGGRRVAVTGGGGFVGAHVVARLVTAGARPLLLGPPPLKQQHVWRLVERGTAGWLPQALAGNPGALERALRGCDALVHLGYRPPERGGVGARLRSELRLNVWPTADLLEAAGGAGVPFVAFASSADVYPPGPGNREDGPVRPTTPYAMAKLVQEELVRAWSVDTGRPAAVVRPTTVYGPGETVRRAIPNFISAALRQRPPQVDGRGAQPFAPVYVGDLAELFVTAVRLRATGTYNAGGGVHSVREVADLVIELCGATVGVQETPLVPQRPVPLCDVSRAAETLGFRNTPIALGLAEQIRWLRDELDAPGGPDAYSSHSFPGEARALPPSGPGPFDAGRPGVGLA